MDIKNILRVAVGNQPISNNQSNPSAPDTNRTAANGNNTSGTDYLLRAMTEANPPIGMDYNYAGSRRDYTTDELKPKTFGVGGGSAGGLNYNVRTTTYPEKTAGTQDLQHYMAFFINVRGKSAWKARNQSRDITPIEQNRSSAAGLTTAGSAGVGAGVSVAVGGAVLRNINEFGGLTKGAIGLGIAGAGAYLGMKINENKGFYTPDKSARISKAIMLAIATPPEAKYGITYEGTDLGTLVGRLADGTGLTDLMGGQNNRELAQIAGMNIAQIPAAIADLFGKNLNFGDALQAGTAMAPNPFREQIFRNVQTREFTFKYKFLPRSASEAASVKDIVKTFKLHMHPEISGGGLFYIYPSTFDIAYYYRGQENTNFHKISTCVLEDLNVDYGGQGFNTFADGMPTEVNLSLRFRELEVLSKERIDQGY
jgi:hypothetical protein